MLYICGPVILFLIIVWKSWPPVDRATSALTFLYCYDLRAISCVVIIAGRDHGKGTLNSWGLNTRLVDLLVHVYSLSDMRTISQPKTYAPLRMCLLLLPSGIQYVCVCVCVYRWSVCVCVCDVAGKCLHLTFRFGVVLKPNRVVVLWLALYPCLKGDAYSTVFQWID